MRKDPGRDRVKALSAKKFQGNSRTRADLVDLGKRPGRHGHVPPGPVGLGQGGAGLVRRDDARAGMRVTVDAMGNTFAVRPGRDGDEAPATFAGSHLDTQPSGGRYDGILGVLAGVEMLRVLEDHRVETAFPVGVVNWTK